MTSQLRTTAPRDCHCSAQLRPPLKGLPSRATACRYVYTGPGGVSSLATDPPGTPVAPCRLEVLHLFRWSTHTQTPCAFLLRSSEAGRRRRRRRRRRRSSVYIRRGLEDFGSNHLAPGLVGQVVRSVSERSLSDACDGQDVHATET